MRTLIYFSPFRQIVLEAKRLFANAATRIYNRRPDCFKKQIVEACTALESTLALLLLGTASAVNYCDHRLPVLLCFGPFVSGLLSPQAVGM
jgi:hypothetical protein